MTKGRDGRAGVLSWPSFLVELLLYAALVVAYFFLVLRFLGDWIADLHQRERVLYSALSLALIVGQGVILEAVASVLVRLLRGLRS